MIRSHFFKARSNDDPELICDLEAELYARTSDEFQYRSEAQVTPIGTKMDLLPHTAWIDGTEAFRKP